jgi:hypothetical protein
MTMRRIPSALIIAIVVATVVIAQPAAAQTTDRIFISVDGTYQAGTKDFDDGASFPLYAETATFTTAYHLKSGPAFNIAASGRVLRQLAVGIAVSRFSRETPIAVSASLPHPFFFSRARSLSAEVSGMYREERAVHVQARALLPTQSSHFQAAVFGGPSFFTVTQDVLNQLGYAEAYPYDSVTATNGQSANVSTSKVGFNAGADIAYFFTRQIGVGGIAQYAGTTMKLDSAGGDTVDVKIGGFQVGGGLRLRF